MARNPAFDAPEFPELPVIPISASLYNRLAATIHARFEVDGDRTVLLYNGQAYVAVGK